MPSARYAVLAPLCLALSRSKAKAQRRFDKHAKEGSAPPLHLWIVPCYTDVACSISKKGCPCGNYVPGTNKLKPADQQWHLVKPQ